VVREGGATGCRHASASQSSRIDDQGRRLLISTRRLAGLTTLSIG
jgi:hypothetical protein